MKIVNDFSKVLAKKMLPPMKKLCPEFVHSMMDSLVEGWGCLFGIGYVGTIVARQNPF